MSLSSFFHIQLNDFKYCYLIHIILFSINHIKQVYSHLPPISRTIQIRWKRHAAHYWRSKNELISNVLLWTPSHGWASVWQPTRTYLQQLCMNPGCSLENLMEAMDDRDEWQKRVRDIFTNSTTSWRRLIKQLNRYSCYIRD